MQFFSFLVSRSPVVLNWGQFWCPGDILQCLETFLVVSTGETVLLGSYGWNLGMLLNVYSA